MRSALLRIVFAVGLFLALQEITLRALFPLPEVLNFDRYTYSHVRESPSDRPVSLGNASFSWASDADGFEFVHRLNLYGFRDGDWRLRAAPGVQRLAFFGDSFVEGFSTDGDETIPAVFEALAFDEGLPVEVLNLGVGGAQLPTYAALIRDAVPLLRPDAVILVVYANDVVPTRFDPRWLEGALQPEYSRAAEPRLLYVLRRARGGLHVPRRWIAAPFAYLAPHPDPRNPFSNPKEASRLGAQVAPRLVPMMKRGRLSPWLAGWYPWAPSLLVQPVYLTRYLRALDEYVESFGGRLQVVYVPLKDQPSDRYQRFTAELSRWGEVLSLTAEEFQRHALHLSRACRDLGIQFLDLTPAFRQLEAEGPALYWNYDGHLRPRGYRAAAELIFEWWRAGEGATG